MAAGSGDFDGSKGVQVEVSGTELWPPHPSSSLPTPYPFPLNSNWQKPILEFQKTPGILRGKRRQDPANVEVVLYYVGKGKQYA